jgi:gamma-glutamyl-gamma-aminobutyrate hydrolase PuuD
MKIALSMETTRLIRQTWHSAVNHEWYDFLNQHTLIPLCSRGNFSIEDYDAVIFAGGNDMAEMPTWRDNHDPVRDRFEQTLLASAVEAELPIMGICRGFHFLNWAMGGTLRYLEKPYDSVEVELDQLTVTCHHTIGIDTLAPGFECLLKDKNDVIELVRDAKHRILGVGWHPEREINRHTRPMILDLFNQL